MLLRALLAWLVLVAPFPVWAQVGSLMASVTPSQLCPRAIDMAERRFGIPARLLLAIGRVESGRKDPVTGQVGPWPWTANAEGQGLYFDTKPQAIAAITALRAKGMRSIDIGCMQINLLHHPDAFTGLEQGFDPMANADYAARFLRRLFEQTGSWEKAAAWYHSATPELGQPYQARVMAVWAEEQKRPAAGGFAGGTMGGSLGATPLAAAWRATLPDGASGRGVPVRRNAGEVETGTPSARAMPMAARTLESYRAAPITWVYRPPSTPVAVAKGAPPPARSGVHFLR